MKKFKKGNVIIRTDSKQKAEELKVRGYKEVTEADLKPKSATKQKKKEKEGAK